MDTLIVLANHGQAHLFGWYLGYGIAIAVIVAVVVLVAAILALAERIGKQAQDINNELRRSYVNTATLGELKYTIDHAEVIVEGLRRGRASLGGQS